MIYLIYLLLAAIVVFVSVKCAHYVDLIDKKSNLSGAFIGGVILAAVTSLPEMITSISAVTVVHNPGLVMGNVLGSNIFNLFVLAMCVLIWHKMFVPALVAASHKITLFCTLLVYAVLLVSVVFQKDYTFGGISVSSIAIVIIYLFSIKYMAGDEESTDAEDDSDLTLRQIIFRFVIMAVVLVVSSVCITYVTNLIELRLHLGASLAGALFLGVATSLPELSSSVALVRKGNYNAMVGNIIGSNMFNYFILVVGDLLLTSGSIYTVASGHQTNMLILFGFIASVFTGAILLLKKFRPAAKTAYSIFAAVVVLCYVSFLVFSA